MKPLAPALYPGLVGHTRRTPRAHALRYPILSILTDIDGAAFEAGRLTGWSPRDHGQGHDTLRPFIEGKLREKGVTGPIGRIQVLTAPRRLGLVFNPLSVFFAFDTADRLCGLVFEVNNFHGGRGNYVFAVEDPAAPVMRFECPKDFFVSPFNPVDGVYHFKLEHDAERYRLGIQYFRDGACTMSAVHTARREALSRGLKWRRQLELLANAPRTVAAILIEALKLRLKGLRIHAPRRGTIDTQPWRS